MDNIRVDILNPKALRLLKDLADMNPIGSDEKADLQEILVYNGGALQYVTINAIKEQQEKINNLE